jgi:hypothetical protein
MLYKQLLWPGTALILQCQDGFNCELCEKHKVTCPRRKLILVPEKVP